TAGVPNARVPGWGVPWVDDPALSEAGPELRRVDHRERAGLRGRSRGRSDGVRRGDRRDRSLGGILSCVTFVDRRRPMNEPLEAASDPFLEQEIERALKCFQTTIPAAEYEAFREILRWHLATEPVALRLVKAVRPPPVVFESADVDVRTGQPV